MFGADAEQGRTRMSQTVYLGQADAARRAAAATDLPEKRAMHERSAAVWEEMARSAGDTAERARINQLAKAQ